MAKKSKKKKTRSSSSETPAKTTRSQARAIEHPSWSSRDWLWASLLMLAVIVTYLPVWHAGFIWDDDFIVTANPVVIDPSGLKAIWTTSAADICPLTLTTFWIEHALWGLAPLPYHLVNVLMHGGCAIVLWRVLRSLLVPGAWLGAALWALHPVEVESVAWISEMKNTQSGLFFLLSILFFLRWLKERDLGKKNGGNWTYALTLLFAAMAMMSKSSTVILPVVLCLCAWWQEGRWQWRKMASVAPIFLISLATAAVSVWTQRLQLAIDKGSEWARGWPERLATAGDAVWFYLGKLLWPHPLMTVYPHWAIGTGQSFSFLSLVLVMGVLLILWLKRDSWSRPWFFVFAYFLVALLPALGLVDNTIFRYSLVFDHFQYLASMGPLALAGAGLVWASGFVLPKGPWLQPSLCAGLLLLLGTLSWQRARVYESQETLWTDALAKNPDCWEGYNNLGDALLQSGRIDEAMAQIQKALAINHQNAETHYNLGNVYKQMGRVDEAISEYQKALAINPDLASAPSNLGIALALKGRLDEAIIQFQKALEINPNFADAHNNLGNAYLRKGQVDEAIPEFQKALEIKPDYAEAHSNLARALSQKGQSDEALAEYDKSQKIDPDHVVGSLGLGLALLQKGRVDEAMIQFQQILEIDPNNALAHNNLGWALFLKGQVDEAIPEYQKALEIDPTYVGAYNNLGWAYLQAKGQPDNAIIQFQKALAIDPNYALAHTNLGSALFQKGKYAEAAAQFQDILRQNPNDADAQSNLAKMQALVRQPSASK